MKFKDLLLQAKTGSQPAFAALLDMYKPLLVKNAILMGKFDEDLYQELCIIIVEMYRGIPAKIILS